MLKHLLNSILKQGSLTGILPGGRRATYGVGEPHLTIRLHDRHAVFELATNPDLKLGELYMDGRLTVEDGDIADLLALLMRNLNVSKPSGMHRALRTWRTKLRSLSQFNPAPRAKRNVAHHYDLSSELYAHFLDRDLQYSCAYFPGGDETLEEAQIAKKHHIAAKLLLDKPGLKVLDIGCGWGGLALDLARDAGASVLGVTLSEEQIAVARERSEKERLADICRFKLVDYRALSGVYDRIVSVGMFEHVGVPHYGQFFDKVRQLLADDGVMLLHTIGRLDGPGSTNPWIAKYIFPGGYVPSLSELTAAVEKSGLLIADIEILRLHYAKTIAEWRRRFNAQRTGIAKLYDERFCRMWEFYLAGAEMAFRYDDQVVFQVQVTRRLETLPLTRDYMIEAERRMHSAEVEPRPVRVA
ncbi:MAG TPA: cyclopropane-fatty-acyl-phospholipid synthase family protein [Rhizomicrobium sp.]|nr:cyclopropane-fatty-acyl-phospholipid synthase family protein [Rhizomicrobium sp.]